MCGNNTINIQSKNKARNCKAMLTLKMMLGSSVFMTSFAHKSFHFSVHWTSLDVSNQVTYSLCLSIRNYDISDIEFYTVIKNTTRNFE